MQSYPYNASFLITFSVDSIKSSFELLEKQLHKKVEKRTKDIIKNNRIPVEKLSRDIVKFCHIDFIPNNSDESFSTLKSIRYDVFLLVNDKKIDTKNMINAIRSELKTELSAILKQGNRVVVGRFIIKHGNLDGICDN